MNNHPNLTYTSRLFSNVDDIDRITGFVRRIRPESLWSEYPSLWDLPDFLAIPKNQETTRLWFMEDGSLAAFAYVDGFHTLRFDIDWALRDGRLESEIASWGEACVRIRSKTLYGTSHETDKLRLEFFDRHGFEQHQDDILHMSCSLLDEDIPSFALPAGFSIRQTGGEAEAQTVAALHRAAFGLSFMTTERRIAMMHKKDYDPELDLVAEAHDGSLAANMLGQVNEREAVEGTAYADLFATHPDFRGLGLAKVLMGEVLRRLRKKGFWRAKLSTGSSNTAMLRVAQAYGFLVEGRTLRYGRQVQEIEL